jgi:MGT family glycosyltransferase
MTKYAFFSVQAYGHVNPTLAIVQELAARGEQVVYYLPAEFRHTVEANGATFHSLDLPEFKGPPPNLTSNPGTMMASFMGKNIQSLPTLLPQILASLRIEQPDCIVYDAMTLWGYMAARLTRIPAVKLHPTYVISKSLLPAMRGAAPRPGEEGGPAFPADLLREAQPQLDALYAAHNLPSVPLTTSLRESFLYAEALNICFIPRSFQPEGETFDDRYVFVGPSLLPRHEAVAFPLAQLTGKQVLYISLGTGFNNRADIYNACFKAFADTAWQVVLARGKKVDPATLDPIPANFIVADYVPQLEVLQHTSVFISHGGMNSTMESLYYGVPLVVLPQMAEQAMTARQVQKLGLGVSLDGKEVSADGLLHAVQQITDDAAFAQRAQAMQQTLHEAGGYRKATDVLMHYVSRNRGQHTGSNLESSQEVM